MNRSVLTWCAAVVSAGLMGCSSSAPVEKNSTAPKAIETYIAAVDAQKQGDNKQAAETLRRAIAANPKLVMARNLLGQILRDDNQYDQAAEQYEHLVQMDPYWFANHYNLALCYQMLNELPQSAHSYLAALNLKTNDVNANTNLALVYLALKDMDHALYYAQRATEADAKSARAFANLGIVLDARNELGKAEVAYLSSIELDSNQPATLLNYAANLLMQNKPQAAISTLRRAVSLQNTPLVHKRLGDAYLAAKRFDFARQEYDQALKLSPQYYPALNQIGQLLVTQYKDELELDEQKKADAIAAWQKSLEINADQPQVRQWISQWQNAALFGQ